MPLRHPISHHANALRSGRHAYATVCSVKSDIGRPVSVRSGSCARPATCSAQVASGRDDADGIDQFGRKRAVILSSPLCAEVGVPCRGAHSRSGSLAPPVRAPSRRSARGDATGRDHRGVRRTELHVRACTPVATAAPQPRRRPGHRYAFIASPATPGDSGPRTSPGIVCAGP